MGTISAQPDLFEGKEAEPPCSNPVWQGLPQQARNDLQSMMARLILDHVRGHGPSAVQEARDDS
ncbi:hypothetical protein AA103196_1523 [Ameyamaea chiangmaiensis NBRC 103196]|uniref:Uncharacterized protein n=1 Tax=Ameyamaea chiangmaiensis TaxID=442969 RepID=A0A850P5A7_9PROT|nr:hypothetical protein [Ameyamaea chiangmaiensis]MBS4076050.1 hypothetical protein [Ameyamaea chiangmaiensis]NVN39825.1 hypothetical protein [Ameyamaea chiangmaiensis]GBQ66825.1 hypothetical protein AA103196_1523 [Ameyamaea chiangmaiensis NBRC 103196]